MDQLEEITSVVDSSSGKSEKLEKKLTRDLSVMRGVLILGAGEFIAIAGAYVSKLGQIVAERGSVLSTASDSSVAILTGSFILGSAFLIAMSSGIHNSVSEN